ncbi:hypothetical protein [Arcobacter sp. CECT 8985]|uniref:hypothetical protein n=1 Tax=Arcobacter sp. CECT 8985 TaxID=1935424 RepID=UPI00100AFF2D|nr:hypothetical protein [Arcobacter sp. CECT 8985]RXJ86709.1 hypothetical protein CRU93_07130 [Arcobacter sp. CECT 8985]
MPHIELIEKVKAFLKQDNKKDVKKSKVIKILNKLIEKKQNMKKEIKKCENKKEKQKLQEKLEALKKLIKKTKKLI